MAKDPAQIRAQIEALRARIDEDIDELGPVVARRLHRARRLAQFGVVAGIGLVVVLLLPARKLKHRRHAHTRGGLCSKCHGKLRRR
jgi:hypothetical protein